MEKEIVVAMIGGGAALGIAVVGWIFAWAMQRDAKAGEHLRKRVEMLEYEVKSRMEVETTANKWIAELANKPEITVMKEVRDLTEERTDFRPRLSPRDARLFFTSSR